MKRVRIKVQLNMVIQNSRLYGLALNERIAKIAQL